MLICCANCDLVLLPGKLSIVVTVWVCSWAWRPLDSRRRPSMGAAADGRGMSSTAANSTTSAPRQWGTAKLGAALIKNYSSYVQNKKSSTCYFPKTGARGPETTPRQVADTSPLLADSVPILSNNFSPKSTPLALNARHFYCMLIRSSTMSLTALLFL